MFHPYHSYRSGLKIPQLPHTDRGQFTVSSHPNVCDTEWKERNHRQMSRPWRLPTARSSFWIKPRPHLLSVISVLLFYFSIRFQIPKIPNLAGTKVLEAPGMIRSKGWTAVHSFGLFMFPMTSVLAESLVAYERSFFLTWSQLPSTGRQKSPTAPWQYGWSSSSWNLLFLPNRIWRVSVTQTCVCVCMCMCVFVYEGERALLLLIDVRLECASLEPDFSG